MNSQTVLIKQTVPEDFSEIDNNSGPNRRSFSYPYFGIGWHIDQVSHQTDTFYKPAYMKSWEIKLGTREKLKINGLLALGLDLEASAAFHRADINNWYIQTFAAANLKKEKYQFLKLGTSPYIQINLKPKRGNQLGTYFDLGVFANYLFNRKNVIVYGNTLSKETTKVVQNRLQNVNKIEYGALLRFGQNTWALYAKYRYSDSFKNTPSVNLPRLTIGFEYFIGNV